MGAVMCCPVGSIIAGIIGQAMTVLNALAYVNATKKGGRSMSKEQEREFYKWLDYEMSRRLKAMGVPMPKKEEPNHTKTAQC